MADTITIAVNPTYQSLCGKTLAIQAELLSKLKTAIVDVTYDTVDYDIGGNLLDLSLGGRITTLVAVQVLEVTTGIVATFIPGAANGATLGKLKIFESGTASAALDEADDADVYTFTCKLRVFGF